MDKTFLGLLDNHTQAIKTADGGKNANDVLLKTVKLLLDKIDGSEACLAKYDKSEMKQLFSSFGKVTKTACDFYQASKKHLDPVALNGEIGRNLETTTKETAKINALMESIEKNNAELLKEEKKLNEINKQYEKLDAEISRLKKIKETVSDNVIKALTHEMTELIKSIKKNQREKNDLKGQIKDLEHTHQALSSSIAKANARQKEVEENIISTIDAKKAAVEKIFADHSRNLNTIITEIEGFKKQYSQLDDSLIKAKTDHDFYSQHLGENGTIVKKLKEYKVYSIDSFLLELSRLETAIKTDLERHDKLIRNVLIEQEKINAEGRSKTSS